MVLIAFSAIVASRDYRKRQLDSWLRAGQMGLSEQQVKFAQTITSAGNDRAVARQRAHPGHFIYKPIEPIIVKNKADVFFELYRQRQQLTLELQDRSETLRLTEMFTALLAHDLRSPLSAILASAQLLQRCTEDSAAREAAARMESSGRRMARMIEDLLDLARARLAGGIVVKREASDLRALVERVVREHQAAVPARHIESSFDGDLTGMWDPERIAQVASNLIGNAVKHGDAGGLVSVRLEGSRSDSVALIVRHAGTIPPDVLAHLFDPFRGGPREPGRSQGLGLGLYIVSRIVQAHQGSVSVKTGDGNETAFLVQLPRTSPR